MIVVLLCLTVVGIPIAIVIIIYINGNTKKGTYLSEFRTFGGKPMYT